MATVTSSQVEDTITDVIDEIQRDISYGYIQPVVCGATPAVFVALVGRNRYHIQWNYQKIGTKLSDNAVVPHPEDYKYAPIVYALIQEDGSVVRKDFARK